MIWKTTLAFLVTLLKNNLRNFKFRQVSSLVIFAIFGFFLIGSANLQAQVAPVNPPTGGFHIDGDLQANTNPLNSGIGDWIPGPNNLPGYFVFNMDGSPVDPVNTFRVIDAYKPNTDNIFAQGSKADGAISSWAWTTGNANGKGDINNVLIHIAQDPITFEQWIMIGSDRLETNGVSYIDFELLQDPNVVANDTTGGTFSGRRTIGDILIAVEYVNGGSFVGFRYFSWNGSAYVENTTVPIDHRFCKGNEIQIPNFTNVDFS